MYRNVSGPRRMPVLERSMTVQEEGGKSKVYRKQTSPRSLSFKILPLQNLFATRKPTPRKFPNPTISPPNYEFQNISFYAEPADKIVGFPTRSRALHCAARESKQRRMGKLCVKKSTSVVRYWKIGPMRVWRKTPFWRQMALCKALPFLSPHPTL